MAELLEPAIRYGDEGFPVGRTRATVWKARQSWLRKIHGGRVFLNQVDLTPISGDVWRNASQAALLKVRIFASAVWYLFLDHNSSRMHGIILNARADWKIMSQIYYSELTESTDSDTFVFSEVAPFTLNISTRMSQKNNTKGFKGMNFSLHYFQSGSRDFVHVIVWRELPSVLYSDGVTTQHGVIFKLPL